jgi:hypothetical protein
MHRFLQLKKLNQRGFDHVLVGVAFAVIIALGGTYYLIVTRAATATYVQLALNGGNVCFTGENVETCNTTDREMLFIKPVAGSSNFQLKDQAGYCVDDWNGGWQPSTKPGEANRVLSRLNTCYGNDANQEWNWTGSGRHALASVGSGGKGCLNSAQGKTTPGNPVIVYQCDGQSDENWIENAVSVTTQPSTPPPNNGGPAACSGSTNPCTTGEISYGSSASTCITAGNSVTMQNCTGAANQEWEQLPTASGSSTEVFYNVSTSSYLGTSGNKIVGTSTQGSALWTAGDNGDGTNMLEQLSNGNTGKCLDAGNGSTGTQLTLVNCGDQGTTSQSFTLPTPYVGSSVSSSQGNGSSANGTHFTIPTSTSPSTSTSSDINALLQALKNSGGSFNCAALSASSRSSCKQIFGQ